MPKELVLEGQSHHVTRSSLTFSGRFGFLAGKIASHDGFGAHVRAPCPSSKLLVVLVKRQSGFTKTLFSLFFQGFLP